MLTQLSNFKTQYLKYLEDIKITVDLVKNNTIISKCNSLAEQINNLEFNVVVIGQFKRGKSTLINYFIGEEILPTGVVTITNYNQNKVWFKS